MSYQVTQGLVFMQSPYCFRQKGSDADHLDGQVDVTAAHTFLNFDVKFAVGKASECPASRREPIRSATAAASARLAEPTKLIGSIHLFPSI
jgi:hypothetical protein